jgi:hypothetical protein
MSQNFDFASALRVLAVLSVSLLSYGPVAAHHSFPAEFLHDQEVTLTGNVNNVWWKNPHARFSIDVPGDDGTTVNWELQTHALSVLRDLGWNENTLKKGMRITVHGNLARRERKKLSIRWIDLPDGTRLVPSGTGSADEYEISSTFVADPSRYPRDISGTWDNSFKFKPTVDDLEPKPTPYTAEGRRRFDSLKFGDDPALRCLPTGMPRLFGAPRGMQIFDAGVFYLMVFETGEQFRRVFMDGRTAPDGWELSYNGYSVGHWKGNTLVIETTHLLPGMLDGSGMPMSGSDTRLVEEWTVSADGHEIDRVMTIYDPLYSKPMVRRRGSHRSDIDMHSEACDADSFYHDLLEQDLVDEYFKNKNL